MSEPDFITQELPANGFEKFLEENFRKLVWLCVIIVLALIAYGFYRYQSNLKANEAAEAFTSAKTIEDCDLVISRHPGSAAAANALLLKANLLWDQNKKSTAVDTLKEFTTKYSKHPLVVNALLGLGTKMEAMEDHKEARAIFERVVSEFPSSEAAPLAQVRLGDLFWAEGKQDEAKKAYEDLAVKFPDRADFQSISQERLGWIAASLPTKEVDPPPAPKVEAKPAPAAPGTTIPQMILKSAPEGLTPTLPGALVPAAPAAPPAPQPPVPAVPAPQPAMPPATTAVPEAKPAPTPVPAPVTPPAAPPAAVPAPAPQPAVPVPTPVPPAPAPVTPPPAAPKP